MGDFDQQIGGYVSRIRRSFDNAVVVLRSENGANKIVFAIKGDGLRYSEKQLLAQARHLEQRHPIASQNLARLFKASQRSGYFLTRQSSHANEIAAPLDW
jgi:spermidine synthase